jgi:clan AA aspartic protease
MGITFLTAEIANPHDPKREAEIEFLVDTGALYSVVPSNIARELGLKKLEREQFTLADGTHKSYDVSEAVFKIGGRRATSKVVFGPASVTPLLGVLTMESLGLMVNPVTREVSPMKLFLAASRRKSRR